jgi:hypothetical protein
MLRYVLASFIGAILALMPVLGPAYDDAKSWAYPNYPYGAFCNDVGMRAQEAMRVQEIKDARASGQSGGCLGFPDTRELERDLSEPLESATQRVRLTEYGKWLLFLAYLLKRGLNNVLAMLAFSVLALYSIDRRKAARADKS